MAISKVTYNGETLIDLTGDTVAPEVLLQGYTATDATGKKIDGTAAIHTPDVSGQIAEHDASETSHADIRDAIPRGIKSEIVMLSDVELIKGALLENQIITFPTQHCNADNYICKFLVSSWPKQTWTDAFVFNVHSDCTTVIGNPGTLFAYNQFGLATMATQKYDLIAQFIYYDDNVT